MVEKVNGIYPKTLVVSGLRVKTHKKRHLKETLTGHVFQDLTLVSEQDLTEGTGEVAPTAHQESGRNARGVAQFVFAKDIRQGLVRGSRKA